MISATLHNLRQQMALAQIRARMALMTEGPQAMIDPVPVHGWPDPGEEDPAWLLRDEQP